MNHRLFDIYEIIESAVDQAFVRQKFNLNLYNYLKENKFTKNELEEILNSSSIDTIKTVSTDLSEYIEGGSDEMHKQIREAYGYLSKPLARKVQSYLDSILEDVIKYKNDKGKRFRK